MPAVTFPMIPSGCAQEVAALTPTRRSAVGHAERYSRTPRVRNLHLTFDGDPASSIVVQWSTDAETLASEVRVRESPGGPARVVQGYSFTYDGAGHRRQHEVHVCGLSPARTYYYDAGGSAARSLEYPFTTAPAGPSEVRVLVAGDARSDPATWRRVARKAGELHADVLFFSGDVVSSGSQQRQWDAFFEAGQDLLASTPIYSTDGNHEGVSEVFHAQFAFRGNGDLRNHERWYSTMYGPIHLVVLNDTTVPPSVVAGPETDFLRTALAGVDRVRTPWLVTLHHRPMFTTSAAHAGDRTTLRAWGPLFDAAHVNVDLAGHVHSYESTRPLNAGIVTDDSHGTRHFSFGGAGAPLYGFRQMQSWIQAREKVHGFALMTVSSRRLTWTAYREDGTVIEVVNLSP